MLTVKCSTSPFKTIKQPNKNFARLAEKVNGRLAMQGVTWGSINQFVFHEGGVQNQLSDPHNLMTLAAVTTLVTLGTSVTQNASDETTYFSWTPEAETLNGRLAMCGITLATLFNI